MPSSDEEKLRRRKSVRWQIISTLACQIGRIPIGTWKLRNKWAKCVNVITSITYTRTASSPVERVNMKKITRALSYCHRVVPILFLIPSRDVCVSQKRWRKNKLFLSKWEGMGEAEKSPKISTNGKWDIHRNVYHRRRTARSLTPTLFADTFDFVYFNLIEHMCSHMSISD